MATNEFVPFATGSGANALTPSAFAADPTRQAGVQAGTARSNLANTAWRQASTVASAFGQFIVRHANLSALDDGDIETLVNSFVAGLRSVAAEVVEQNAPTSQSLVHYGVASGSPNAILVNETPPIDTLQAGHQLELLVVESNTTAVTIDVGVGGAKAILRRAGQALLPGDLSPGVALLIYDGSSWRLQGFTASDIPAIIATYWRLDSPNASIPANTLTTVTNYGNKIATVGEGTAVNQSSGTVTIGPNDGGVYVLSATNAMDQPTIEESIYIYFNGNPIAVSRGVASPSNQAMDKSVSCIQRLSPGDTVSVAYLQINTNNIAANTLNQFLGHFGGVRVGG